ncbi:hypothetical protein LNKW23_09510 [Paralimibaculum aggregatum]|uniref:DUF1468 domain-containing protein n=1 Tax=Paralimibaculum aggregatum TaxID=3036245 RepID=A0ABQ6LEH0_9RHOB|nr:tripartite tricarboxylate transporter TctB family protein [Limibaculum sp. NKW23]GMG81738.1 hypothetical protein LNKW23_09510 [Limibaculum sp. NKW23]
MMRPTHDRALGLGIAGFSAALIFWAVPGYVVSPEGGSLVLRPDFWPTILGWLLLGAGLAVALQGAVASRAAPDPAAAAADPADPADAELAAAARGGLWRLAGLLVLLIGIAFLAERFGLVWASVIGFWALVAMVRAERPWLGLVVGVVLPLLLYAFFAKFAGVPIPQGVYVRLP